MSSFYQNLPLVSNNSKKHFWLDNSKYHKFDENWFVVSLDIKESTLAIEKGEYKKVNMLASASIVAFLNASDYEIPFVFGGDGATILVPFSMKEEARRLILMCQRMAHQRFDLELRGNLLSVIDIYKAGKKIEVLKEEVDERYIQAIFKGGGLRYADDLMKSTYVLNDDLEGKIEINLEGLECRWQNIKSPLGVSGSILIDAYERETYEEVFEEIERCFGTYSHRRPVTEKVLNLSFSFKTFFEESMSKESRFINVLKRTIFSFFENILGYIFMKYSLVIGKMPWGEYKEIVTHTTDSEKFEDILKMVIASDEKSFTKFEIFLNDFYKQGKLNYGIHTSDSSIMTCLVFERHGKQVHFIDSTEGGYSLASKAFKQRQKISK